MENFNKAHEIAKKFHDIYETLAPQFGYETREDTKDFSNESPNGKLMIAVCSEVYKNILDEMIDSIKIYQSDRLPSDIWDEWENGIYEATEYQIAYLQKEKEQITNLLK